MFKQINLITALLAYAQANQAMHKRTQDDFDGTFDIDEDEFSDDWEEFESRYLQFSFSFTSS